MDIDELRRLGCSGWSKNGGTLGRAPGLGKLCPDFILFSAKSRQNAGV
jgi:hypothetical protein